jgi:hypothetical protein
MIKVNFFPKKQSFCLVYSKGMINSFLFKNLYIQSSPKDSLYFRLLKSRLIVFARSFFLKKIEAPKSYADFVGMIKPNKTILFEFKNDEPVLVWRKKSSNTWDKSIFLGYPLLSEYSLAEFSRNKPIIRRALSLHWNAVISDEGNIHGDLTHFNVLKNSENGIVFIDKKSKNHSKLFDFFYFYSYLRQCLERCTTLSKVDANLILVELSKILRDTCEYRTQSEFVNDFNNLNIPEKHGLIDVNSSKKYFRLIFN